MWHGWKTTWYSVENQETYTCGRHIHWERLLDTRHTQVQLYTHYCFCLACSQPWFGYIWQFPIVSSPSFPPSLPPPFSMYRHCDMSSSLQRWLSVGVRQQGQVCKRMASYGTHSHQFTVLLAIVLVVMYTRTFLCEGHNMNIHYIINKHISVWQHFKAAPIL